jgi:hypothetical protein
MRGGKIRTKRGEVRRGEERAVMMSNGVMMSKLSITYMP